MKLLQSYNNMYSLTSDGKVFSHRKNKFLRPQVSKKGYLCVYLYKEKYNRKAFLVHRLVAQHYLNNYSNKLTVNHKDLNKYNNNYTNLEMMTNKQNINHGIKHSVRKNYRLKLSKHDFKNINKLCKLKNKYGKFNKYKVIARRFKMAETTASAICNKRYSYG